AWRGLLLLLLQALMQQLGPNPVQKLEIRTGRGAMVFLLLSLLCMPLFRFFGWQEALHQRRRLGLYALLYATLHALIFLHLDYGLAWNWFAQNLLEKPYLLFGIAAFLILVALGATSFDVWKQRLGRNWKRLHRLVYLALLLTLVHVTLSQKGNLLTLQGQILRPLVYIGLGGMLLLARLKIFKRGSLFKFSRLC
ncbi:MAG: sulfite oxidase heme-binding subunit YedZ, partial [Anaerolineales bacterium]